MSVKHSLFPAAYCISQLRGNLSNNSDKVEVLTTPKGARNPLGPILLGLKKKNITTHDLSELSVISDQITAHEDVKFNHTGIRSGMRINNIFWHGHIQVAVYNKHCGIAEVSSKRCYQNKNKSDLRDIDFFIFGSQICIWVEGGGVGTCRQVINIADQSKCKAGR